MINTIQWMNAISGMPAPPRAIPPTPYEYNLHDGRDVLEVDVVLHMLFGVFVAIVMVLVDNRVMVDVTLPVTLIDTTGMTFRLSMMTFLLPKV